MSFVIQRECKKKACRWSCRRSGGSARVLRSYQQIAWNLIRLRVSRCSLATPRQAKNITELYTPNGQLDTDYVYTPYGAVCPAGNITQPIQWSSEYHDTDLGLIYYNYRYYNPTDGRWTRRDPIGNEGGENLYRYANNAGIVYQDFLGQEVTYVQFDNIFGHAWIRLGGFVEIKPFYFTADNALYVITGKVPLGKGFYPADDYSKIMLITRRNKGEWLTEEKKELLLILGGLSGRRDVSATEYSVKVLTSFWSSPKLQYGSAAGKKCSCTTEAERLECLSNHIDFKIFPNYNLVVGNCRDRAKKVLKDCCMKVNLRNKASINFNLIRIERVTKQKS